MPVLCKWQKAAEPLVWILIGAAVDTLTEALAEELVTKHLCPQGDATTLSFAGNVLLQVEHDVNGAECGSLRRPL